MVRRKIFVRSYGERAYRKLFVIAAEGSVTEHQYFSIFRNQSSVIQVKCLPVKYGSPSEVLKKMKQYIKNESLKKTDEAWLVVDKDNWTDEQLVELYQWSQSAENYGFALSNPKFEYWLLLHFDDGNAIASVRDCVDRLNRSLPDYNKKIEPQKFTRVSIDNAIRRAKLRDNPPCIDWPRTIGSTTVYKLVEHLRADEQ